MLESITAFDAIAVAVIVISAIMAFARGFLREIATLGSFIAALAAAFYARRFFADGVRTLVPEGVDPLLGDLALVVVAFIIVYVLVAWFGQRLSKNIQGADGIGMFDHFAGLFLALRAVPSPSFSLPCSSIWRLMRAGSRTSSGIR